jgi:hypothetical protein
MAAANDRSKRVADPMPSVHGNATQASDTSKAAPRVAAAHAR